MNRVVIVKTREDGKNSLSLNIEPSRTSRVTILKTK